MLALKESQNSLHTIVRWVNGDAQLANSLTKKQEQQQLNRFLHMGCVWTIVEDSEMFGARKRKEKGMDALQDGYKEHPGAQEKPR